MSPITPRLEGIPHRAFVNTISQMWYDAGLKMTIAFYLSLNEQYFDAELFYCYLQLDSL